MLCPRKGVQHSPRWAKRRDGVSHKIGLQNNIKMHINTKKVMYNRFNTIPTSMDLVAFWLVNPKGHKVRCINLIECPYKVLL